jgi:hypothetical protein
VRIRAYTTRSLLKRSTIKRARCLIYNRGRSITVGLCSSYLERREKLRHVMRQTSDLLKRTNSKKLR